MRQSDRNDSERDGGSDIPVSRDPFLPHPFSPVPLLIHSYIKGEVFLTAFDRYPGEYLSHGCINEADYREIIRDTGVRSSAIGIAMKQVIG